MKINTWIGWRDAVLAAVTTIILAGCATETTYEPHPAAPEGSSLIDNVNGTGSTTSRTVNAPANWQARYTYSCGTVSSPLSIDVYNAKTNKIIPNSGAAHSSSTYGDGTFSVATGTMEVYFKVTTNSSCDWQIGVSSTNT